MNKAGVLEIRKQFTQERCTIDRICSCYVNHEKEKLFVSHRSFGSLPEEETFKYLELFKHTLGGTFGKNLLSISFPLEEEMTGGKQEFLLKLRDGGLKDEALVDEFFDLVIANYANGENYYIILVHASYDVPGVTKDGIEMEDASENVYEYLLCSICPVTLSKAGLGYNEEKNVIEERNRDWQVEQPGKGFLFPAFIDRASDIHELLYFTKKPDELHPEMIEALFGTVPPLSSKDQREGFQEIVQETIGEDGDYAIMQNIHENLNQMMEDHEEEKENLSLSKKEVKQLLQDSGVEQEKLEQFDKTFEASFSREDYPLLAGNIANTRKFELETPDVIIKVNPERADLVETRWIDGRQCLVIKVDDHIEVNGVQVRTLRTPGQPNSFLQ
ncbi:MAG: DUF4317 domain-containing protein [Lachnospiraceae bacterium]|nr:DUF4317 domain-containing protein [Lachnospiraceae bacterium]MBF1001326.1 DUF4317 domain-containing protein [Lachnospiraceae bacterium]